MSINLGNRTCCNSSRRDREKNKYVGSLLQAAIETYLESVQEHYHVRTKEFHSYINGQPKKCGYCTIVASQEMSYALKNVTKKMSFLGKAIIGKAKNETLALSPKNLPFVMRDASWWTEGWWLKHQAKGEHYKAL